MTKILLADDEATFRETLKKVLDEEDMEVTAVADGTNAINAVMKEPFDVAILDIQMPGADGIKVLREIMRMRPETRAIMITAYGTVEMAVEAIKIGACDYVMKPVMFDDILAKIRQHLKYLELRQENKELKRELNGRFDIGQIIGQSPPMQQVFEMIRKVAPTKSNVLITGDSGTGKELVAPAPSTRWARRTAGGLLRLIAVPYPRPCLKASCSATKRAVSPPLSRTRKDFLNVPGTELCFWMRSVTWP
jgi:two-component system response regulator PilR (NtrC family)